MYYIQLIYLIRYLIVEDYKEKILKKNAKTITC